MFYKKQINKLQEQIDTLHYVVANLRLFIRTICKHKHGLRQLSPKIYTCPICGEMIHKKNTK